MLIKELDLHNLIDNYQQRFKLGHLLKYLIQFHIQKQLSFFKKHL